jgi:hypothetical protein
MLVKIKSRAQPDYENKLHLSSIKNVTAVFFALFLSVSRKFRAVKHQPCAAVARFQKGG